MPTITIEQIERAINVWRNLHPAPEGMDECPTLCDEARVLADIYALMIIQHWNTVDATQLSRAQLAALQGALTEFNV